MGLFALDVTDVGVIFRVPKKFPFVLENFSAQNLAL